MGADMRIMDVCWEFKMSSARGGMVGRIYMRRGE